MSVKTTHQEVFLAIHKGKGNRKTKEVEIKQVATKSKRNSPQG